MSALTNERFCANFDSLCNTVEKSNVAYYGPLRLDQSRIKGPVKQKLVDDLQNLVPGLDLTCFTKLYDIRVKVANYLASNKV